MLAKCMSAVLGSTLGMQRRFQQVGNSQALEDRLKDALAPSLAD